jgi:GntR family transcriptional regulator
VVSRSLDSDGVIAAITIDRSSPVPLYYQLSQQLVLALEEGRLAPGMQIETELALADRLGLSRPTVRRALKHLVDSGVIVRRRGVGTRVVSPKVRRPLELSSLHADLQRNGQRPTSVVLTNRVEPATPVVAEALEIAEGTPVTALVRVRYAMDQPIARLTNFLAPSEIELSSETLQERGLYELIRAQGVHLHSASQVIGARNATPAEARLLAERKNAAVLTVQRISRDDDGIAVEYGNHIYAASRYSFELTLLSL